MCTAASCPGTCCAATETGFSRLHSFPREALSFSRLLFASVMVRIELEKNCSPAAPVGTALHPSCPEVRVEKRLLSQSRRGTGGCPTLLHGSECDRVGPHTQKRAMGLSPSGLS